MKFNIVSAVLFICASIGFFIAKQFYLDELYFEEPNIQVVERIKNNNDLEHLKSVAEGLVKIEAETSKSYNDLLANAVNLFMWISFLAAILSVGALLEAKQKPKHSNQSLHTDGAKRRP